MSRALAAEFSVDPFDKVFPVKAMSSQTSPNPTASVRHCVVHIPVKDIVASPQSVEIRENAKKHVNLYGPLPSCYKVAEKTVGGAIYDVSPFAKLELIPLTTTKFSIRLSTVCDAQRAESSVISNQESSEIAQEPTVSFILRWDRSSLQVRQCCLRFCCCWTF